MQMETVEQAEAAIANLQAQCAALIARGDELANIRAAHAFAAFTDADSKLDWINCETAAHGSELASFNSTRSRL
jgi:type II secretory pathway component PulM